ncbi:MAG: hypothetical protein ABI823_19010 [Bryobacteraceae bacterium]
MTLRFAIGLVSALLAVICSSGCGAVGPDAKLREVFDGQQPMALEAEQVVLTDVQVKCGIREELWEEPRQVSGDRTTAKLTQKGRDLKFSDDVTVQESTIKVPYVQVRGSFPATLIDIGSTEDTPEGKIVNAKVGITVAHSCFASPLKMMGVKHGNFSPEAPVVLRFTNNGEKFDRIVH